VHGLFASAKSWDRMRDLLQQDESIAGTYSFRMFEYRSPFAGLDPRRRIPDLNSLADSLATLVDSQPENYERVVIVTHSQGGLIAQRYLARQLHEGHGHALARVRRIVMFACPNNGSEFMLTLRRGMWWRHSQERELRPLADSVIETQRRVLADIIYAPDLDAHRCPIPIAAYAGDEDGVVTPASAKSIFPNAGVVPGDHSSVIRPSGVEHVSYLKLKSSLLAALKEPFPSHVRPESVLNGGDDAFHVELTTLGPVVVDVGGGATCSIYVQSGPVDHISDVDIIATSENIYMQMAMTFKPSVSGRLRRAGARKSVAGEILEDVVFDELNAWMREHGRYGLPVEAGTVAPTSAGELRNRGIHRIYHAAIGIPILGSDAFDVNPQSVATAVHRAFELARQERVELELPLRSICLPLFGAGLGGLSPSVCFEWMWRALAQELRRDPTWEVHFCTWSKSETELVLAAIQKHGHEATA
jgi:pimeloyl-ACP methyl ester carboxylesterase/O-acetyl-ADP-ribose deacetylase (regulator of RNase III)